MDAPHLSGLRVLELPGAATMYCARHFADLGAEVWKVEPPGGDPARNLPPLIDRPGADPVSATWLSCNLGKRSCQLDLATPTGRQSLARLVAAADVVIHGLVEAEAAALGLTAPGILDGSAGLVTVAVTPFGFRGPLSGWHGSDLVSIAMSGYLHMTGEAEGRPIRPSAPIQSLLHAGNHGLVAALLALRRRRLTGRGAFIDQSIRDTGTWMLTHTYQHWDMQRLNLKRQGQGRDMGARKRLRSVYRCADGYITWMFATGHIGARSISALIAEMDRARMAPPWLLEIDWLATDLLTATPGITEQLEVAFQDFFLARTRDDLLEFAIASGLMLAPINGIADLPGDPQLAARGAFQPVAQPGIGTITVPAAPVHLRGIDWRPRGPAPALPEPRPDWTPQPQSPAPATAGVLPLQGVRVLDLGTTLAAPVAARLLADFGAEVIKVESQAHPDTLRVGTPYAPDGPVLDRSGYFAAYNAGKRSFALNLQAPGAHDVLRRLVERSDVLIENFAPGVMGRLGLEPATLHSWNPRLVIASHSLQGQTGPRSRHRGYGQVASAMTGWYDLTGEEGGEPLGPYSAYTDFLSWPHLLAAVLVALEVRDATGRGQYVDHAQLESSLHFLAPLLLEHELTGRAETRRGNHEDGACPSNAYRGRDPDAWIAVSIETDRQFVALCEVLCVALADDPRFRTHETRKANESALDAELDRLIATCDVHDLAYRLQEAGVPAGPVNRASDLFADPQFDYRRFFRRLDHPVIGAHAVITHSFRMEGLDPGPSKAAPLLGEHTYEIASEVLGLSDAEIAALTEQQLLY
jgi:crotonobetainyl-CoA:carnitine CoA-transferase CaiB-like acyl-CoA transferase